MNDLVRKQILSTPMIGLQEIGAISQVLDAGEAFGYGNMMAWLATAWAVDLRDATGMSEKDAIHTVSGRGPHPLPKNPNHGEGA